MKEYESQIKDPSLPLAVLAELLNSDRVIYVHVADLHADVRAFIKGKIKASKPRDRMLAMIAALRSEVLVSDDFQDFTKPVRKALQKKCNVVVVDSCEADEL